MTETILTERAAPPVLRSLLHEYLSSLPDRLAHTLAVGDRAAEVDRLLKPTAGTDWVVAAYLHDIGYGPALADTGLHQLDGARYVRSIGGPDTVCSLIAWHSCAQFEIERKGHYAIAEAEFPRPTGDQAEVLDLLTYCDMTTSPTGRPVSYDERIGDILHRYASDHPVAESMREAQPLIRRIVNDTDAGLRAATHDG